MGYNLSAYHSLLILTEIIKKYKNCGFLCVAVNRKKFIFLSVRMTFEKVNNKRQTYVRQSLFGKIY